MLRKFIFVLVALFTVLPDSTAIAGSRVPDAGFPAEWWKEISKVGVPDWEILPQEAGPGEVILSKRTELGVFSNFAATPFEFNGERFASLEGFWQMMKYPENAADVRATFPGMKWEYTRQQVSQMTAFEAKHAGDLGSANMALMKIDWVTYRGEKMAYRSQQPRTHYDLIRQATWAKLNQHPELKALLLKTGDLVLKPDHIQERKAPPEWRYFELYMQMRAQLRSGQGPNKSAI